MSYRRGLLAGLVILLLMLVVPGCSDDDDDSVMSDIIITVGTGTSPEYSWTGGDVFSLSIVRVSDPTTIVWGLATPGQDNLVSSIVHGTVPSGAVETFNVEDPLTAGVLYRATVSRLDAAFGFTDFTP